MGFFWHINMNYSLKIYAAQRWRIKRLELSYVTPHSGLAVYTWVQSHLSGDFSTHKHDNMLMRQRDNNDNDNRGKQKMASWWQRQCYFFHRVKVSCLLSISTSSSVRSFVRPDIFVQKRLDFRVIRL